MVFKSVLDTMRPGLFIFIQPGLIHVVLILLQKLAKQILKKISNNSRHPALRSVRI